MKISKILKIFNILIGIVILISPVIIVQKNNYKINTPGTSNNVSIKTKDNFNKWRKNNLGDAWSNGGANNELWKSTPNNVLTTYETADKKLWVSAPLDNLNIRTISNPKPGYKNNTSAALPTSLFCSNDGKGNEWTPIAPTLFGAGKDGNEPTNIRATIYSIFESKEGVLFVGGKNLGEQGNESLFYLNSGGKWTAVKQYPFEQIKDEGSSPVVKTISQTEDNAMWFGGWYPDGDYNGSSSLYRADNGKINDETEYEKVTKFSGRKPNHSTYFNGPSIKIIKQTADGTIWVGGHSMGINFNESLCYLEKGKSWKDAANWINEETNIFAHINSTVNFIYQKKDKSILLLVSITPAINPIFYNSSNKLYRLNGGIGHYWQLEDTSDLGNKSLGNVKQQFNILFETGDGSLWIGGTFLLKSGGQRTLFRSGDGKGDDWKPIDTNGYSSSSIYGACVYSLRQSDDGYLWVGGFKLGSAGKIVLYKANIVKNIITPAMSILTPALPILHLIKLNGANGYSLIIIISIVTVLSILGFIAIGITYLLKKKRKGKREKVIAFVVHKLKQIPLLKHFFTKVTTHTKAHSSIKNKIKK